MAHGLIGSDGLTRSLSISLFEGVCRALPQFIDELLLLYYGDELRQSYRLSLYPMVPDTYRNDLQPSLSSLDRRCPLPSRIAARLEIPPC